MDFDINPLKMQYYVQISYYILRKYARRKCIHVLKISSIFENEI